MVVSLCVCVFFFLLVSPLTQNECLGFGGRRGILAALKAVDCVLSSEVTVISSQRVSVLLLIHPRKIRTHYVPNVMSTDGVCPDSSSLRDTGASHVVTDRETRDAPQ